MENKGWRKSVLLLILFTFIFGFFSFINVNKAQADITSSLVGHWTLDAGSGTTAADSSASGNSGTLANGPTWTTGRVGSSALSFDGSNDYVTIPDSAAIKFGSGPFTISAWVSVAQLNGNYIFGKFGASGTGWAANVTTSGRLEVGSATGGGYSNSGQFPLNQWVHVVIVAGTGSTVFYVNGVNQTGYATALGQTDNTLPLLLGTAARPPNGACCQAYSNVAIDDFRLYSRALSATDATELYNFSGGSTPPPTPPPPGGDTTAPVISNISSSSITQSGATISWTTNETSDTQIDYGTSISYGSQTTLNSSLVTSHAQALSGLSAGTLYNYRVRSRDAAGNVALSSNNTFTTSSGTTPPPTPPPPSGSNLATLAASMAPGTWAALTQTNINNILGQGGSNGNISPYGFSAAWDPVRLKLNFTGNDHGDTVYTHAVYDAATNVWSSNSTPLTVGHAYDHTTLDPKTGTLYVRIYGSNNIWSYPVGGPWSLKTSWPPTRHISVAEGADWWTGSLSGAGANGALIIYNGGAINGQVVIWDPLTNQWIADITEFGGTATYHGFIEYSAVHNVAVFGGGNDNARKVWRLNSNRTVTALPDSPVELGVQKANVVPDPVTGNFLVMGYGQMWELDPRGSGTWTQQTGSRVQPSAVGNPGSPNLDSVFSAALPNYNVVTYVTCRGSNCNMYLYKHASGGTPTPPPPAGDTTAPTTSITAPTNGSTVTGTAVTYSANASDNVGVARVEFYVDGTLKSTDTGSPYSFSWDPTNAGTHPCSGAHTHTLQVRAFDAAGNQGTSSNVSVNMNNPSYCSGGAPTITSISPSSVTSNVAINLTVNGTNFASGFTASVTTPAGTFPLSSGALTFISATQVQAQVTMGDPATGQNSYSATLTITSAGQSATGNFTVNRQTITPPPIPPPTPPPTGSAITTFQLTSGVSGTQPFTVGLGFKKGDIPGVPTLNIGSGQVIVKSRWNDNSVKHAIASGQTTLTAGVPTTITVQSSSSAPGGTNLTSADIASANPSASVSFGSFGTVNLSSLLSSPFRTWISGPEMVEAHYRSNVGSDPTLQVWFYVRLYKGGKMFIRAVGENGYVDVTTSNKTYSPVVTVGGATVYNPGSITHYAHTRWTGEGWIGGDPQVTPKHDTVYLMASRLVPNYWKLNPSASALNGLYQNYVYGQNGGWTVNMGNTGFQAQIGLLPLWDAMYISSGGDVRAFKSVIANTQALSSYPIVWNDSVTKQPTMPSNRPNWTAYGNNGGGGTGYGAGSLNWDIGHHGSGGYLAYLITGDYYFLETMEDQSSMCYLMNTSGTTYDPSNGPGTQRLFKSQTRAAAWCQRTVGQLAGIGPTSDPIVGDYRTLLANNVSYWNGIANLPGQNLLGYLYSYEIGSYGNGGVSPWQQHFWVQTYGHISDLEAFSNMATWNGVRDHLYKSVVGILGPTGTSNYCYSNAGTYIIVVSSTNTDPTTWFDSWGQVYQSTTGSANTACGTALGGTSGGEPGVASTGYWGNLLPAIAYAVDHGATGASASWSRLTSATNWSTLENSGFDSTPNWGIVPRTGSSTPPPTPPPPTPTTPTITSFTASPSSITTGQSSTLSWSVSDATSLSINQGIGTVTGTTRSVSPTVTTTYTLTATNAQGSVTAQATVTVTLSPDTTAPTASITAPTAGTVSATITYSATASDPTVSGQVNSGINLLSLFIDGSLYATTTTSSISRSLNTTALSNGNHALTARAQDNAGNQFTTSAITINVNNAAAQKFPRTITLSSLEGLSAIPGSQSITVSIMSGSTVIRTQTLAPTSNNYTVTFQASDPQIVDVRVTVNKYLSRKLTSLDTTLNSASVITVPQLLAGDLNNDNSINTLDYSTLNSSWNQTSSSADINGDGFVNSLDYAVLKNNWNRVGE